MTKIYAIYDGDKYVYSGTAKEIVEKGYYKTIASFISAYSHQKDRGFKTREIILLDEKE